MKDAIRLEGVTLSRRTQQELHYDLKRTMLNLVRGRRRQFARRTVLHDIDLSIEHGEKVAVIGPNGSGKSTLLKVIAGVLVPTRGTVFVDGRISALIELGVGFDPELSVLDNILYYGVLLGHEERQVAESVDSILWFAELEEYRNEPTKTLSSGMSARLGFAIATEFVPDVLILDEVLAVGDESFRRKCATRIERFWNAHVTIVVVSHDIGYVSRMCNRGIWIDGGRIHFDGPAEEAGRRYLESVTRPATPAPSDLVEAT